MSVLDDATRSPDPRVCPFFRRDLDGVLVTPLLEPDESNRCAAIGEPRPQSDRQQELVCLRDAHLDCPRYHRGAQVLAEAAAAHRASSVPRATVAALLILVLSAGISFGFVVQRGGIDLPVVAAAPSPSGEAQVASPGPDVTDAPASDEPTDELSSTEPSASPVESPEATPAASPSAELTASPEATAAPTPAPTPIATIAPSPQPSSGRYALLKPCPDQAGCWIYRVRSGDNLYSIANYFGVKLATIYAWNPKYKAGAHLKTGDPIRMPPPTK